MDVQPTDAALLEEYVRDGNEHAFSELVARHLALIYGLAYRELGDHHLAEEVCQNAFCALAESGRKRRKILTVPAWLYGTTRKQIAHTMRTERRLREREQHAAELNTIEREGHSLWDGLVPTLNAALGKLSDRDQTILFLRYYEGRTFDELSILLGIRKEAARKRLQRAVCKLRGRLQRQGVALTAGLLCAQMYTAGGAMPPAHLINSVSQTATSVSPVGGWLASFASTSFFLKLGSVLATLLLIAVPIMLNRPADPLTAKYSSDSLAHRQGDRSLNLFRSGPRDARTMAIDDIEAIYSLPTPERELAIRRLVTFLQSPKEQAYLSDLFKRWAALDAPRNAKEVVGLFRKVSENTEQADLLGELLAIPLHTWFAKASPDAKAWVAQLPRTDYAEAFAFEALLQVDAKRDLETAYATLQARPYNRDRAFDIVAIAVKSKLPTEGALSWLQDLSEDPAASVPSHAVEGMQISEQSRRTKSKLWAATLPLLFEQDRHAVCDWMVDLPASSFASEAIGQVVELWAREDPQPAGEWALSLERVEERSKAINAIARIWSEQSPKETLEWTDSLPTDSVRWAATEEAFSVWLDNSTSFEAPKDWLTARSNETSAAPLFEHLGSLLDGTEAFRWAQTLSLSKNRTIAMENAFFALGQKAPEDGIALLDKLPNSERPLSAANLTLGWIVGGGREAFRDWLGGLPVESPLYFAAAGAELDLIAAFDPNAAVKRLQQLPAVSLRDPLAARVVERTMHRSLEHAEKALSWTTHILSTELRNNLRQRAREAQETTASPTTLPEMGNVAYQTQSLSQLRSRLDALSQLPVR